MKFMRLKSSTTVDESQCTDCTTVSLYELPHPLEQFGGGTYIIKNQLR